MEHVTASEEPSATLMYRVERPVFSEGYIDSELLHRKKRTPKSCRRRIAEHFRYGYLNRFCFHNKSVSYSGVQKSEAALRNFLQYF